MTEHAQGHDKKILGILQAGRAPEQIINYYPDYNELFVDLLGKDTFTYRTWAVLDNEFPRSVNDADAWLITGSRHGAYEPHDWIPPLEKLITQLYAKGDPMVGICFGHQIIAQALGGRVEKFSGGWSVGRVEYSLDESVFPNTKEDAVTPLMAFHQDQVVKIPEGAVNVGSTSFCKNAALMYNSQVLTLQPHPEFDHSFISALLEARGEILPTKTLNIANATLHQPIAQAPVAQALRMFLMQAS